MEFIAVVEFLGFVKALCDIYGLVEKESKLESNEIVKRYEKLSIQIQEAKDDIVEKINNRIDQASIANLTHTIAESLKNEIKDGVKTKRRSYLTGFQLKRLVKMLYVFENMN